MTIALQVGELATRLARALGVRGATPLSLDQIVEAQVHVLDLDRDPYRTTPRVWQYAAEAGGTAGDFGNVTLFSAPSAILVVRRAEVHCHTNPSAVFMNLNRAGELSPYPPVGMSQGWVINTPLPQGASGQVIVGSGYVSETQGPGNASNGQTLYTSECDPDVPWEFIQPDWPVVLYPARPIPGVPNGMGVDSLEFLFHVAGVAGNVNLTVEEYQL